MFGKEKLTCDEIARSRAVEDGRDKKSGKTLENVFFGLLKLFETNSQHRFDYARSQLQRLQEFSDHQELSHLYSRKFQKSFSMDASSSRLIMINKLNNSI